MIIDYGDHLSPIQDAPGYAETEAGQVYRFDRKRPLGVELKPFAEFKLEREPGLPSIFRRTGRLYFPIFRDGEPVERRFWTPPPGSPFAPAPPPPAEDLDDCPF